MAKITASGETMYGRAAVEITDLYAVHAGADHMKQAFPKKFFDALELYSLLDATMKRSISS